MTTERRESRAPSLGEKINGQVHGFYQILADPGRCTADRRWTPCDRDPQYSLTLVYFHREPDGLHVFRVLNDSNIGILTHGTVRDG